jgi:putative acetyltransferase
MQIELGDLSSAEVRTLLNDHLASVALHSPPESIHALGIEALHKPEITFWTVRERGKLLGCGALRELDRERGEIKSMKTVSAHLRKGVAKTLLAHLLDEARRRGYRGLFLETGSAAAFEPARNLYASFGFSYCGPFGDYVEDPYSVFMTKAL